MALSIIPGLLRPGLGTAQVLLALAALASTSWAKDDLYVFDGFHFDAGVELGVGGVGVSNANFGLGRFDPTGAETGELSVFYFDGYTEPYAGIRYKPGEELELLAKVSAVLTATRGDGDPAGFTAGDEEDVDLELAYAGFSWMAASERKIEFTVGAQDIKIGNGFLIWDGNFDTRFDANYWTAPRSAFDWAVVAKFTDGPLVLASFVAEADEDNGNPQFLGGDAQWSSTLGTFGVTGLHIFDDMGGFGRDGLSLVSARVLDAALPAIPKLKFSSEIAHEFGDGAVRDFDAWGGYGQIAYGFDAPWSPILSYRFSYFSGGNATDPTESFDPLFFGAGGGWGTWFQGEIVGEYLLFNSNEIAHQVKLSVTPADNIGAGVMYFHFDLDRKQYFGTPVSSTNFADEVNLYVDWNVTENFYLGAIAGAAIPAKAAEEIFGNETIGLFEVLAIFTY